ncbi:tetratricopeptide repeat protein, partial [bacterium]|nr:tetratricopeptide repeat protein [bacterium]
MDSQEVEKFKQKADGKKYEATILLADIIGCADISNEHSIEEYACILNQFHESAYETYEFCRLHMYREEIVEFGLKGDEACLILHSRDFRDSDEETLIEDIKSAIIFAISIKLLWQASPYNKDRVINNGLFPRDVAIGINQGPVYFYQNPDFNSLPQNPKSSEGYAINLAKRIETKSRSGSCSNIFTSSRVKYWAEKAKIPIEFKEQRIQGVKGITTISVLYEVSRIENKFVYLIRKLIEKIKFDPEEWRSFRRLAEINPTDFWTNCLVHFKEEIRKKKEIITEMPGIPEEKKISEQDTAFYLDEARKNYSMGNYEEAIKLCNKAIEIDDKCSWAYCGRGSAYADLGQYNMAIEDYTKALEIDKDYSIAYYNRGLAHFYLPQYNMAIEDYTKA